MKFNIPESYLNDGLVVRRKHPEEDLWIYNYTPEVQFERLWDKITTSCRGLILDKDGTIIGQPFKKFFNYGEPGCECATDPPYMKFEKLDGSLIIICNYKDRLIISSRGSFDSEQANWAKEIVNSKYKDINIITSITAMFELIHPNNKIVVDYGDTKDIYYLGFERIGYPPRSAGVAPNPRTPIVEYLGNVYDIDELKKEMAKTPWNNKEGYVLQSHNGYRLKLKYPEYVRIHKLLFNLSRVEIWRRLMEGEDFPSLKDIPDEAFEDIKNTIIKIKEAFKAIYEPCKSIADNIKKQKFSSRREMYEEVAKYMYYPIVLSIVDGNLDRARQQIFKLIRPHGESLATVYGSTIKHE